MPKHKILVIDDEKPTLGMFLLFLKAYGYEVLLAENGSQGLEIFEAESPAIVFTDVKMPGMDGIEVLDRIKSQAPETEVIVITGHGDIPSSAIFTHTNAVDHNPQAIMAPTRSPGRRQHPAAVGSAVESRPVCPAAIACRSQLG